MVMFCLLVMFILIPEWNDVRPYGWAFMPLLPPAQTLPACNSFCACLPFMCFLTTDVLALAVLLLF